MDVTNDKLIIIIVICLIFIIPLTFSIINDVYNLNRRGKDKDNNELKQETISSNRSSEDNNNQCANISDKVHNNSLSTITLESNDPDKDLTEKIFQETEKAIDTILSDSSFESQSEHSESDQSNIDHTKELIPDIHDVKVEPLKSSVAEAEKNETLDNCIHQLQALIQNQNKTILNQCHEKINVLNDKISELNRENVSRQQEIDILIKQLCNFISYLQSLNSPDVDEGYKTISQRIINNFFRTLSKAGIEKIEPKKGDPFDESFMQAEGECQQRPLTPDLYKEGFKVNSLYVWECLEFGYKYFDKIVEIGGNKRIAKVSVVRFVD